MQDEKRRPIFFFKSFSHVIARHYNLQLIQNNLRNNVHTCTDVHTLNTFIYTHIYVYTHLCIHTFIYTHIYIYTHSYIHTFIHSHIKHIYIYTHTSSMMVGGGEGPFLVCVA